MNRNDEFTELMKELDEGVPEIGESIKKGSRRKARKQFLYQPLMGLAAVFMLFVLSVNLCTPVAMAFSKVPVLKDLTKAVAISRSVKEAIENNYIQEMELTQTKDGVTVEIVSAVVDQGKLSVFYRFESETYKDLTANCTVYDESGKNELGITDYEMTDWNTPNEEIRCVNTEHLTFNVTEKIVLESMPEKVQFHMVVWDREAYGKDYTAKVAAGGAQVYDQSEGAEKYCIAEFDFLLDLTLENMPEAVTYEVNQELEIEGSKYTVTNVQVYPTYMRIGVKVDPENTLLLENIVFYVETEDGEHYYSEMCPIMQERIDEDTPYIYYFDAESPYFSEAESLKLVVTGVVWSDPEKDRAWINLVTGETSNLPENVSLKQIYEQDGTTYIRFEQQCEYRRIMQNEEGVPETIVLSLNPFLRTYYDGDGNEHKLKVYGFAEKDADVEMPGELVYDENGAPTNIMKREIRLNNYSYDEIYLTNGYTDEWKAEDAEEVSIAIK